MPNAIDGLGSINVTQLVTSLMSVEGTQQKLLQAQQTKQQSTLSALQTLNTNVFAVQNAAEKMITSVIYPRPWAVNTATSSSTSVSATAASTATAGSYNLDVLSVATAHKELYGTAVSTTANVGGGTLTFTQNGAAKTLDLTSATTLGDVITAINKDTTLGVKASAVKVGTDSYRLQLSGTSAGAASQFTVSGLSNAFGTASVIATGADSVVKFGPGANDTATSTTNTFNDLFTGMSFTVTKPETGVVVSVGRDTSTMAGQVTNLVSAVNTALSSISGQSKYDAATRTSGPLLGESLPTKIADSFTSTLFSSTGASLATYGVGLDAKGALTFDSAKFTTAMTSDPAGATAALQGLATRLGTFARQVTNLASGSLTGAIRGRQSMIADLGTQITSWDARLAAKKKQLTAQYNAVNTQISNMANQATFLTSQLSSLSSSSTTSSSTTTSG